MNRWHCLGVAYGLSILFGGAYLNSRLDLLDWAYGGTWWHLPVAATAAIALISLWAEIMTEGTIRDS